MMTYLAQFRNIKPEDIKKQSEASQTTAYGPGLIEVLSGSQPSSLLRAHRI